MAAYFENFPLIRYSNTYARNIATRAAFSDDVIKNRYVYYPYELKTELRPDLLSSYYYENPFQDWIILVSNKIIDPYYQWYLSNEDLNNLIESKYGSLSSSSSKIHHWEVNWLGDDTIITSGQYQALTINTLQGINEKKYWQGIFDVNGNISSFKRKELELQVEINKLVNFDITLASNTQFANEEKVFQLSGSVVSAFGYTSFSNTSLLTLKNVSGTFSNTSPLIGEESSASASFTQSTLLSSSFPEQEAQYWNPVSFYDYEIGENEKKRTVYLIDKSFSKDVQRTFEAVINA